MNQVIFGKYKPIQFSSTHFLFKERFEERLFKKNMNITTMDVLTVLFRSLI